jgi:hypothetical protein
LSRCELVVFCSIKFPFGLHTNSLFDFLLSHAEYDQYEAEKQAARSALLSGNSGRSRVCARRAAGILARSLLEQSFPDFLEPSLFNCVSGLLSSKILPYELEEIFSHFTVQVDSSYSLPLGINLVSDLERLETVSRIVIKEDTND